ncbi:39795_t:CDS:2 [Gigaspora margarita]|uniref:39795_t:CDS:1 n=1 Tax=Gigaspora margarita TaxID=4874 RepID=A0ABN7VCA6_GIGMA|nr:39795_t:CDS:2 [Gigaspora margarita]
MTKLIKENPIIYQLLVEPSIHNAQHVYKNNTFRSLKTNVEENVTDSFDARSNNPAYYAYDNNE